MAIEKPIVHRPGVFKQTNKEHKHGRHRSKSSISHAAKGKISVKTISKKVKKELNREQRRHQALQIRQKKRDEVLAKKRSLGGMEFAPFSVCLLPLNKDVDPQTAVTILEQCDEEAVVNKNTLGIIHISIPRFKQRFELIVPHINNDFGVLDSLKVADTVVFLISAAKGVDDNEQVIDQWGSSILTSSFAQGLPTPIVVISDLESIAPKKRQEFKQSIQKIVNKWLPDEKLMTLDKNTDGINLLRRIGSQKRKSVLYRDHRPHLLADEVEYVKDNEGTMGTLKVTGFLRGAVLSANQLIHIPGLGDYQMTQIDAPTDPYRNEKYKNKPENTMEADVNVVRLLEKCDPNIQESLESENVPDPMDAEQTWPTNEEIEMAQEEQKTKLVKKIPKGWSDYQAAWIPDDPEFFEEESESEAEEQDYMEAASEDKSQLSDMDDSDGFVTAPDSEIAVNDDKYDKEMDLEAEKKELEKLKAAKSDKEFPDEIDTPMDQPARVRFQKYRGLESFRTSPWDPKENLPSDYSRIFQFENFERTRKRIMKEQKDKEGALPGWYITIHIKDVSQLLWLSFKSTQNPLVVIGMFPHEHKMSVLNAVLKRTQNLTAPIKSKERLIIQCGYRRFAVNPIFSSHTNGQKHKFERFFQPEATAVATFYAPIQFPPAPVLCYKEVFGALVLVATGSLLSCNPDRMVVKRIVLSGHPLKIYKRSAVIRFMFFNREDIIYFKPVRLRTKMGRHGHIKEPLGTHGHMKCVFDGQLKSMDTVLLNLYKRVFPKWTYEELPVSCENSDNMDM